MNRTDVALVVALAMSAACNNPSRPDAAPFEPTPLPTAAPATEASSAAFWSFLATSGESLLFRTTSESVVPSASLLFVPAHAPVLRSAALDTTYELGRDFTWQPGSRRIDLVPGSHIAFRSDAELHPPKSSPNSIAQARDGATDLLWSEGHFFHDFQVVAFYSPAGDVADGEPTPPVLGDLPRAVTLLRMRKTVHLLVLGDSISQGYNASGFVGAAPHQAAYPELVAAELRAAFGAEVKLTNLSVAGKTSAWGRETAAEAARLEADVVIVAFGMNDASGVEPSAFGANIRAILETVRATKPDTEFILVASMLGNPEFEPLEPELFPAYRNELAALASRGVAVADLTTLWEWLLRRKHYLDLSGNGVNHPNDFGHRLYARTILRAFGVHSGT